MDHDTYAFSHGAELLAVLTSGNFTEQHPRPAAYTLHGLSRMAGATLCDALGSGVSCAAQDSVCWAAKKAGWDGMAHGATPGWRQQRPL